MKKTSQSVIFFGTGPVAAKSLALLAENFVIEAVITKPKPAHHKGSYPVLDVAQELTLKVHHVTDKTSVSKLFHENQFKSSVGVLIDFGIIIAQDVIDSFERGIVNSHFSLLPEWRGADPITFSILSGQQKTGVSLMVLVERMDEGPLIAIGEQNIAKNETTESLTQKLILLSDALLKSELAGYISGDTSPIEQQKMKDVIAGYPDTPSYSRKLTKLDGILDFSKPASQLEREIRAFSTWPKSSTTIANKVVTVVRAIVKQDDSGKPGEIHVTEEKNIRVSTSNGALIITDLKPAGKNTMSSRAFLAGNAKDL